MDKNQMYFVPNMVIVPAFLDWKLNSMSLKMCQIGMKSRNDTRKAKHFEREWAVNRKQMDFNHIVTEKLIV